MKTMSVRTAFLKLHLWVGLAAALLVTALAISGTMLVFENEIDRALNPMMKVAPQSGNLPIAAIVDRVRKQFNRPVINVGMNPRPDLAWQLMVPTGKQVTLVYVNPHTGEITERSFCIRRRSTCTSSTPIFCSARTGSSGSATAMRA